MLAWSSARMNSAFSSPVVTTDSTSTVNSDSLCQYNPWKDGQSALD